MSEPAKSKRCPFCKNEYNTGHKPSCYFRVRSMSEIYREAAWNYRPLEAELEKKVKESQKCDLCDQEAGYWLCQIHLDDMRYLETFKTVDGDYPEPGDMVLWDNGSETFIGGYDPSAGGWFAQGDSDGDEYPDGVTWCLLPNLERMYDASHTKFTNHADHANSDDKGE